MARNFRTARKPVKLSEVTEGMLATIRRDADASLLPQTVYPSKFFGRNFAGTAALLVSTVGDTAPADAAKDAEAFFTVLPSSYLRHTELYLESQADAA